MYKYALQTPASFSSVSASDLATWLRLNTTDTTLLSSLVSAAEDLFTNDTQGHVLCSSTWRLYLDTFPTVYYDYRDSSAYTPYAMPFPYSPWATLSGVVVPSIFITHGPVSAISGVEYLDADGTWQTLAGCTYDLNNTPARVILPSALPMTHPSQRPAVRVNFTAGYADQASVPALAATCVKLAAAHWYNNGMGDKGAYTADDLKALPMGWDSITSRYKIGVSGNWNR